MFEASTEWSAPENYPDLKGYKYIAIDLETKDPDLKVRGSGAIIGVNQLPNSTCGFKDIPTLTINTNTGVGAELIPVMQFTPNYSSTTGVPAVSGIGIAVTAVIDCV